MSEAIRPSVLSLRNLLLILPLSGALWACATMQGAGAGDTALKTPSGFPTRLALAQIAASSLPPETAAESQREVSPWTLEGPLMADSATLGHPEDQPWEKALVERVATKQVFSIADEASSCVAREAGRFYLAQGAYPSNALKAFIVGRCGSPSASTQLTAIETKAAVGAKPDVMFEPLRAELTKLVDQAPATPAAYGVWLGADKSGKVVLMFVAGAREVHFTKVDAVAKDKPTTVIQGQLTLPASQLRAIVTKGSGAYTACDQSGTLPKFELRCTHEPNDPASSIELSVTDDQSGLTREIGGIAVSPNGSAGDVYTRPDAFSGAKASSEGELAALLHAAINKARANAGLAPVELDVKQTEAATKLAPHYFAAARGASTGTVASTIAFGVRAGWEVDGFVEKGTFVSLGPTSLDAAEGLLARAIEGAAGRQVLLAPRVKRIAIGALWSKNANRAGALIGAYELLEGETAEARFVAALDAARAKTGAAPLQRLRDADRIIGRVVDQVKDGKLRADDALTKMRAQGKDYAGNRIPFRNPDDIVFPEELTKPAQLMTGIGVLPERSPEEPWAFYSAWLLFAP
jgi:hypothetical protein